MASADIGIDLGTSSILVYTKGKGIVLKEPSVVAYDKDADKVKAIGEEARQMIGRTPGNIMAIRPLRQGVISDYMITEKMLKHFIQKAMGRKAFRKPRISICVPSGVTEVERKAVEEATYQAGAREVHIIEEPIAAAIGAGIDITKPFGNLIVDIGGGTTDIAVISLGGVVVSASIKVAGNDFDEAIIRHVRKAHNLFIGEQTAEAVKIKIGTACKRPQIETMEVKGRNVITGTSQDGNAYFRGSAGGFAGVYNKDCGSGAWSTGEDTAGACGRYCGAGNRTYRRRSAFGRFGGELTEHTGINTMTAENPPVQWQRELVCM